MRSKSAAPPSTPPSSPHNSLGNIVADVAQKRYALLQLGPRPDHEKVEDARSRLREIEADLSKNLQEIVLSPRPENFDRLEWRARLAEKERGCREAVEKELSTYRAIISLDVMHEECEKTLREAEKRLVKMYESAEEKTTNRWYAEPSTGEGVRDGPMNLLRCGALEKERVNLSGRMLRLLPTELFGRFRGIKVLNLSSNQLEVSCRPYSPISLNMPCLMLLLFLPQFRPLVEAENPRHCFRCSVNNPKNQHHNTVCSRKLMTKLFAFIISIRVKIRPFRSNKCRVARF